ncbi:hypothetical protein DPMN_084629, partial [Dreissena polymorpha]
KTWEEVKLDCTVHNRSSYCDENSYYERNYRCCLDYSCYIAKDTCTLVDYNDRKCEMEGGEYHSRTPGLMNVINKRTCRHKPMTTPGKFLISPLFITSGIQIYLHRHMLIKPGVCGDGECDTILLETCDTCPMDCGRCPIRAWQIGLIVGFSILGFLLVLAVILYIRAQERKRLYDESWLIPFAEIKEGRSRQGKSGSKMSMGSMFSTASMGGAAAKQVFVKIALVQDRTVAVRVVNKKEFSLTMPIRKEVRAA